MAATDGERVAFVAGATGYTGREVVPRLVSAGVRTVAHVRPGSADGARWEERFTKIGAEVDRSPWEEEGMAETLGRLRPALVFSLLGTTRSRARREGMSGAEAYERIDYGLTRLLLDAAIAAGSRPRFVYLSSLGVSPRTKNLYLGVRARLEAELRDSSLPWTIVRPSFVTGPDREDSRTAERIGAVVTDAVLRAASLVGARGIADRFRSMTGAELAAAMVRSALDPTAEGRELEASDLRG